MTNEERQQIANKVCKWLKFNIHNYTWADINYDVDIDTDELLKDLETEILKEE